MSEGSILKRGKNSYRLKWELPRDATTGRRQYGYKTVRCASRKEAAAELRRILSSIDGGTYVAPKKQTLAQWLETWIVNYAVKRSAKTFERYRDLLNLHVVSNVGEVPVQQLTGLDIDRLYAKLRTEGRKVKGRAEDGTAVWRGLHERTVLHVHRVLSLALSQAVKARVIERNPCHDAEAPSPNAALAARGDGTGDIVNALEREQLDAVLRGLRDHALLLPVAIAASTGARLGEILALRWSDISYEQGTLRIERAVEDTSAEGARIKSPKNKSSRRTIGIDAGLAGLLRSHRKQQAEDALKLGVGLPTDALLFPESILCPATPRRTRTVSKQFGNMAEQIGFGHVRFHDLRHTHATLLLTAGVPINAVAQRLGHSTPVITLTVYGHVLRRSEEQAVRVSGELLSAVVGRTI